MVFDGLDTVWSAGEKDIQRIMVKVAHPIYGKEHVEKANAGEATLQPSDGRMWRYIGICLVVQPAEY